jgi:folate-dependent phosphoribosylglycinamide formyltransferase PurN
MVEVAVEEMATFFVTHIDFPADDEKELHERIKLVEHKLLIQTVEFLASKQLEPSKLG